MWNLLSRLLSAHKAELIEDFSAFVSLLGQSWNPALVFDSIEVGEGAPPPESEARLLFQGSDRATAVVVGPTGDASALDALAALARAALVLTVSDADVPLVVAASAASVVSEYRDYRVFTSEPAGWFILFEDRAEEGFADLLDSLGPKKLSDAAHAAFSPETAASAPATSSGDGRIIVTEPWAACASRLLFPAAVQAGETAIRFSPRSFAFGSADGDEASESWYRFGVKVEAASLGGFWAFRCPPSIASDRFPGLATSLAKAAGAALAAEYRTFGLLGATGSGAAPTEKPMLEAAPVFTLHGTAAVGAAIIEVRVIVPHAYPLKLASLCGRAETDAVSAMLALDRVLSLRLDESAIDSRALVYRSDSVPGGSTTEGFRFVPFHELLGVLSDSDYRKTAQNFLLRHYRRDELAELFYYRRTIRAEGGPKRIVVRPQAFDLNRFVSVLPESTREAFIAAVGEGAAAATVDDFILRNEGVYEAAMADIRRGALELGYHARELLGAVYARHVYPRKRKRLDAMIEADYPFARLRTLSLPVFRSVVDASDFRTLAAALVGRAEAIDEIAAWCSERKLADTREELGRISDLLARGAVEVGGLCSLRERMVKKAEEVQERERLERSTEAARNRRA